MIHSYIKLVPIDFHVQVKCDIWGNNKILIQQQEDQTNSKDNIPPIEERRPRNTNLMV
jgi:hypothetical protein